MPVVKATTPASARMVVSDAWMEANKGNQDSYIDVKKRLSSPAGAILSTTFPVDDLAGRFNPRAITINSDEDSSSATSAWLNCMYEDETAATRERFLCAITHPEQIKRIYPYNSTARGILIKS